ncbi:MAG: APC family permease [Pseudomonadota bacterium]
MSVPGRGRLGTVDGIAIVVGIVVGVGIFRAPSEVARLAASEAQLFLLWAAGGLAALAGGLCYAELASAWPNAGGEYHFLKRAFGARLGLLFVWARASVIQTGAIAAVAFVFGDYASELAPLPPWLLAAGAVAVLTSVNLAGWRPGRLAQRLLTGLTVAAVVALAVAGLSAEAAPAATQPPPPTRGGEAFGMALVFVMLTYGGWNEAAYLAGDLDRRRTGMAVVLAGGLALVVALYLALNAAFVTALGIEGMRGEPAVATATARAAMGEAGAGVLGVVVCVAALSTLNATVITGANAIAALGGDVRPLGAIADRRRALAVQGGWALALVAVGATAQDGFTAMIEFTAPVFWLFLTLVGVALFVLRRHRPEAERPFRVPLYPAIPLAFCATSVFMLWASIGYVGASGAFGLALLALGWPFVAWAARRLNPASAGAATATGRDARGSTTRSGR